MGPLFPPEFATASSTSGMQIAGTVIPPSSEALPEHRCTRFGASGRNGIENTVGRVWSLTFTSELGWVEAMPRGISSRTISQANASAAASSLNSAACRRGPLRRGHSGLSFRRTRPEIGLFSRRQACAGNRCARERLRPTCAIDIRRCRGIAVSFHVGAAGRFLIFG